MPLTQSEQNIFSRRTHAPTVGQPLGGVRQDNPTRPRERIASSQPGSVPKDTRAQRLNSKTTRSQNQSTPKRKTAQLILWVHPLVKAEVQRTAKREGLSASKVGAAFLEQAIQQDIHAQYRTLLQPLIEQTVRRELRSFGNRLVSFLMRIAFASEQSRILITNVLDRMQEVTQETYTHIIDRSHLAARKNITRTTPQLQTLLEEYEKVFTTPEEEEQP
jgi:hypothetical protein